MAKRARLIMLCTAGLALLLIAAVAIYVIQVDRSVVQKFSGRRWNQTAQVYAQPVELYAGLALNADDLEAELIRLSYQRSADIARPGTYRRRGGRVEFIARKARFEDEVRDAQYIGVSTNATQITTLSDLSGHDVPIFRLDPPVIGSIFPVHGEDRVVLAPDEVPPMLPAALIVVEDRKFMTHHGIDPTAITRAVWVNIRAGHVQQGGSTLTQQLVKNYFLNDRQTLSRKLEEAVMAISLERHFTKADLMNAYINEIYLGQDGSRAIHGFGLASRFYFGKPLAELSNAQIALLVGIARGPSYYDPRHHAERARQRRDLVLKLLGDFRVLPQSEVNEAALQPLGVVNGAALTAGYYPAFLDLVRKTLRRDYRDEDLATAGLRIYTTLDSRLQAQAARALTQKLSRLDRTQRKNASPLDGAVVVTLPQSGEVVALLGGRLVGFDGFNRALDANRQIGSLAKPLAYLVALESGRYNAATIVDDSDIEVKLPDGSRWHPQNYEKIANGKVPLVRALAESLNLATVRMGLDVGLPKIAQAFSRLGLERVPLAVPSLLLGSVELSPYEVAQIYNCLAAGGFSTPLRAVRAVVSEDGKPLKAFPLQVRPVAAASTVYQLNRMLTQVIDHGTGKGARASLPAGLVVAGKTGTSSDYRDSWFAGFSGNHLIVVWVGTDDNRPTGLTGASGALGIWAQLMGSLPTASWNPPMPDSLQEISIDYSTGLGADRSCSADPITVAVAQGTQILRAPACGNARH